MISNAEQYRMNEHLEVSDYISNHTDTLFVGEKVFICPFYNTPLISPHPIHENYLSSGWKVGSPEFQAKLKQYEAGNLFQAMVDNPRIKLIINDRDKVDALKKSFQCFLKRFGKKAHEREYNAKSILENYSNYIVEPELVQKVANYRDSIKNRIALLKDKRYFCFHKSINITNRLLIVFGKL